jgi:hypothetical protein
MDDLPDGGPRQPSDPLADLPARATDWVEQLVVLLRDRTVRPLTLVARAIVFGIIVFAASVVVLTLVAITVIRLLTVYAFDGRVWLSDLVVGALFVAAGVLAWSRRTERRIVR